MILLNDHTKEAFFAFVDIRGFTKWSTNNQYEIKKLLDITYDCGITHFGERKTQENIKRIVKFLGDGFYAVNEYNDDNKDFLNSMNEIISAACSFINDFKKNVSISNLHDKQDLGVSVGISFGAALRFNIQGEPIDYSGKSVNISARLCGVACDQEIVMEAEFEKYYKNRQMEIPIGYEVSIVEKEPKKMGKISTFCLSRERNSKSIVNRNVIATVVEMTNIVQAISEKNATMLFNEKIQSIDNIYKRIKKEWTYEEKSKPDNIENGKYIIDKIIRKLIDFESSMQIDKSSTLERTFEEVILEGKKLSEYQVYMDGEKSYSDFWKIGNGIFSKIAELLIILRVR